MKKFICIFILALAIITVWYEVTDDIDFIVDPILNNAKALLHIEDIQNTLNSEYISVYKDSDGGTISISVKNKTIEFEDVSYYNASLFAKGTYKEGDNGDYIIEIEEVSTEYFKELEGTTLIINQKDVTTIIAFGTPYKKE